MIMIMLIKTGEVIDYKNLSTFEKKEKEESAELWLLNKVSLLLFILMLSLLVVLLLIYLLFIKVL
jgi:heme/copper-type cytochrome/quinol oxidase subunit 2